MTLNAQEISNVIEKLGQQERVLIICVYELYDGKWELLLHDLVERLEGRPYVFKFGERIREDIERVKKLQKIEMDFCIRLGDFVKI